MISLFQGHPGNQGSYSFPINDLELPYSSRREEKRQAPVVQVQGQEGVQGARQEAGQSKEKGQRPEESLERPEAFQSTESGQTKERGRRRRPGLPLLLISFVVDLPRGKSSTQGTLHQPIMQMIILFILHGRSYSALETGPSSALVL